MARIVEFYIPENFKPKVNCVPQDEQGRLVVFPSNLEKPALDRSALYRERTRQMSTQSMVCTVITGASSPAIGTVNGDRLGLNRHQNTTDSSSREVLVESSV
jgi:hypothetical protein